MFIWNGGWKAVVIGMLFIFVVTFVWDLERQARLRRRNKKLIEGEKNDLEV